MRYAIPLLTNRISPRCTIAECLLLLDTDPREPGRIRHRSFVPLVNQGWYEMINLLVAEGVETLVCGGISRDSRAELARHDIAVVENVAATATAVVEAIVGGDLRPGYGFDPPDPAPAAGAGGGDEGDGGLDCLNCPDAVCRRGGTCPYEAGRPAVEPDDRERGMLDAALDLVCEPSDRTLCRLSEIIYYGLETGVKRMGVAFCWDLVDPARILVDLLRRHFEVVPVGCKVGGAVPAEGVLGRMGQSPARPCNPLGQASVLTAAGCDLNVALGLCVGADCIFARHSEAPVTTLFVKDRSLANNPIGAIYSDYYLREAMRAATGASV